MAAAAVDTQRLSEVCESSAATLGRPTISSTPSPIYKTTASLRRPEDEMSSLMVAQLVTDLTHLPPDIP